uniref:Uncharacterized protein n=1 Tax=viral metagenome TaxID=1070528 RepID=A0A6C0KF96_9ZZZZ
MTSNFFSFFVGLSYMYGAQRQWKSENRPSRDLFTERFALSLINGALYVIPPFSIFKFMSLLNRIEIKYKGLDPTNYKDSYKEFFTYNYNTF